MKRAAYAVAGTIIVVLARHAAVIPHEYAHSFMPWVLGYTYRPCRAMHALQSAERFPQFPQVCDLRTMDVLDTHFIGVSEVCAVLAVSAALLDGRGAIPSG